MRRRHTLRHDEPLLVGFLDFDAEPFQRSAPPALYLEVFCPYCKVVHTHGWFADSRPDAVDVRHAHCRTDSPLTPTGYHIGLHPGRAASSRHRDVLTRYAAAVERWRAWKEGRPARLAAAEAQFSAILSIHTGPGAPARPAC
jgi:hypothetical protein